MTPPGNDPATFLAEFDAPDLLNLLADGAYITDTDRRIVFWNHAAQRITGWSAGEVVGRSCRDNLLVHVDNDGHALCGHEHCPLHRSIITGQPSPEPLLVYAQHRSGPRIPVEVTVSPVRSRTGKVIGGIELFRDLTESVQDQLRAREIQELAVRWEIPQDPRVSFETRYQPRDIVGGDFFRIEKLEADRYVILVADAKGHGVSAALYTMLLCSLWQELRSELASLARFMGLINERLHALVRGQDYFGTAALVSYDAQCGEVRLVRAGHPAPLLIRATGTGTAIGAASPALGLLPKAAYKESTESLSPGDVLLLYSDGATELFDRENHELGREGLLRLACAQVGDANVNGLRLERLEEQLLLFSNQIHLPDDLTLVKLQRLG